MEKTYSYCAENIAENSIDKMRFELGDTMTEGGADTCVLCDEEYAAMLVKNKTWQKAKIECLKAIVMKLCYEVDYKVDNMSLNLSDRYKHFKAMLDELEKKQQASSFALKTTNTNETKPYFYLGMQENPKAW